jgi:hypothetical protein
VRGCDGTAWGSLGRTLASWIWPESRPWLESAGAEEGDGFER